MAARRELAKQFPGTLEELIAIAAKSKTKVKKLPPVVEEPPEPVEAFVGPCQQHVEHFKQYRAAKAEGKVAIAQDDEPVPTDREKKLAASRAYNKANYVPRRRRGPGKAKTKAKKVKS